MAISTGKGWMLKPSEASPSYVDRGVAEAALVEARAVALVAYDATVEECSSMGGSHAFFTFVERSGVVHFGGHGAHLGVAYTKKGELWIAAIDVLAKPESVKNEMWCVPDRTIDARATAMIPVTTADEGRAILRELGK